MAAVNVNISRVAISKCSWQLMKMDLDSLEHAQTD